MGCPRRPPLRESRGGHAHVQAATLAVAVVDCEPNIVVVMSRFVRGLFQTARTISTIDPTALTGTPGGPSPSPGWNVCSMVQMFVRTVVRMRVIVSYSLLFISISLNIFFPYFSILLDFIFSCATQTLFLFYLPPTYVSTRR